MKQLVVPMWLALIVSLMGACDTSPISVPTAMDAPTIQAPPAGTAVPTGTGDAATVRLTNGKVVLAVINDQSGIYADLGDRNVVAAVQMAAEDFRAKYGDGALGGPVEVINADHRDDPDVAAAKAREA